ncbi:MAG TPA: hypothetical protein VNK95_08780 [Caldilineaceae bacterium]|nr:hypothetical protein [Caldilineaceae bacterium]
MRVLAVWEECNFIHGEWQHQSIPSFWIEARHDAIDRVLPYARDAAALREEIDRNRTDPNGPFYLLVTRNLESVVSLPGYYPYSGQWFGGSPFRELPPVELEDLADLPKIADRLLAK